MTTMARSESRSAFTDRKSTRLNSSHANISYAVFCLKKKKKQKAGMDRRRYSQLGRTRRRLSLERSLAMFDTVNSPCLSTAPLPFCFFFFFFLKGPAPPQFPPPPPPPPSPD